MRYTKLETLPWEEHTRKGTICRLRTPYGKLEVWASFRGCCIVNRDDARLVHTPSQRDAVFISVPLAKAVGLVHLADGFGNTALPSNDGLRWNISWPVGEQRVPQTPDDFTVDQPLSEDHVWGRQELQRLLDESVATASAADEKLLLGLEAIASSWHLPPPTWTKRADGCFTLNTPYGTLVVRRLVGWTVERNGAPLVCAIFGKKVIFDRFEQAKMSALVHAGDRDGSCFVDGTRWEELAD